MQVRDQESIGPAEVAAAIIRKKGDVGDLRFFGEALLRERRIHAHGDELHVAAELAALLAEIMRLLFADGRVQRRHDVHDPDLAFSVRQADKLEVGPCELGVAQCVADLDG